MEIKMTIRPCIKIGDVVKLSKKGRSYPRTFPKHATLVVSEVQGDGIERSSVVKCRVENDGSFEYHTFYRSELWATGLNIFEQSLRSVKQIPLNNDGRSTCYICGETTYKLGVNAICKNSDCEWYKK